MNLNLNLILLHKCFGCLSFCMYTPLWIWSSNFNFSEHETGLQLDCDTECRVGLGCLCTTVSFLQIQAEIQIGTGLNIRVSVCLPVSPMFPSRNNMLNVSVSLPSKLNISLHWDWVSFNVYPHDWTHRVDTLKSILSTENWLHIDNLNPSERLWFCVYIPFVVFEPATDLECESSGFGTWPFITNVM